MQLQVTIEMDNAAFANDEGGSAGSECARILRRLANECEHLAIGDGWSRKLRDANGNTVGQAIVEEV